MIDMLLDKIIEELEDDSDIVFNSNSFLEVDVPTLKPDHYRKASPQIISLYNRIESWADSTHGDWLSLEEMRCLWPDACADERIAAVKGNIISAANNWPDDAYSLYKDDRITLFAGSAYTNERVYLIWFDSKIEPEVWVYDVNGFARYISMECYLQAFVDDDMAAYSNGNGCYEA